MDNTKLIDKITYGGQSATFNPPVGYELLCIEDDIAYITFDFGMDTKFALTNERNFLINSKRSIEENIKIVLIFDLEHAFFHPTIDPNYNHYHWALYGNLKDRATITEEEDDGI